MNKVIYHDKCLDGFGSAYAAWKYFGSNAKYIPAKFGQNVEDLVEEGDNVLIFDINFPAEQLLNCYDVAEDIKLFDHHMSHMYELRKLHFTTIDLEESGATLAWDYFYPELDVPLIFSYLRDRDLWKFELPYSAQVHAYISSYPFNFGVWKGLEWDLESNFSMVVAEGEAIVRYQAQVIESLIADASIDRVVGFDVPVINSSVMQSEIGNALLKVFPDAPFSAVYNVLPNGMKKFSLRSEEGRMDVGTLAKQFGGGGHKFASGLVI